MGEQRFKVGDWVRRVEPSDWPEQYGVVDGIYKVLEVSKHGHIVVIAGSSAAMHGAFEPWQPRVGERVKVTGNNQWAGDGEVTELSNYGVFVILMNTGRFAGKPGGFYIRDIEPILSTAAPGKPASLKIEAGKFYKTRDGRKLGPIVVAQGRGEPWPWKSCYGWSTYYFKEDGFSCPGSIHNHRDADDLIAEWIDEPVAKTSNDNAKPKFKVGDRVEITANDNYRVSFVGSFGTVKAAPANAVAGFRVELDDGREFPFWPSEMTVRPSSALPTTTIVALIENGQPKPSSTPHVHTSTGAAEKEAKRLAAKYKGQQFGVFTLTTTHEEAAPVYDHKWQNMAYLGLKIDAIKELRAVAGLTLKGAKDAVEAWIEYENAA